MAADATSCPIAYERLQEIANEACDNALAAASRYDHTQTNSWNTAIINNILAILVKESTPTGSSSGQPSYKFVVNSTIIQHSVAEPSTDGKQAGRRGMHVASGAYWNNERDGMWSMKYEAAEVKGLDVVVGIVWVWTG